MKRRQHLRLLQNAGGTVCVLALQYVLHIIHMYTPWQLALHSSHIDEGEEQGCMVLCRSQMLTLLAAVAMFGIVRGHAVMQPKASDLMKL